MKNITASKLYDYIQCPHKVWRDVYGSQEEKIDPNPFVQLLWDKGTSHEKKIIHGIGEYLDLSEIPFSERSEMTIEAMKNKTPLIYQGVIKYDDLLGIPDLLKFMPDGQYIPIDIKSGKGFDGADQADDEPGKPKKHYAVQLCLYSDVLNKLGFGKDFQGSIIDISGTKVDYPLMDAQGSRNPSTWWDEYEDIKTKVKLLLENKTHNKPALGSPCKLCDWSKSCKKWCKETEDLTNIFYLGRGKRDVLNTDLGITKVGEIPDMDISSLMEKKKKDKTFLIGIAETTLQKVIKRANVVIGAKPVFYRPITFPFVSKELFFDIENDPTQDLVYMHGVYERTGDKTVFKPFVAKSNDSNSEKEAWQEFWDYIRSLGSDDYAVYYYSAHEKTTYRKMRELYPDVVTEEELETFFSRPDTIDLYNDIILKDTDWPLPSYSVKEIATYLGFKWRDATPSGALSIQWYNDYLEKNDPEILNRILEYNEDDCIAMLAIKDGIEKLQEENHAR